MGLINCLIQRNNRKILKEQDEFIKKNQDVKFNMFGFVYEEQVPTFIAYSVNKVGDKKVVMLEKHYFPATPKLLEFCVQHLIKSRKLEEASDISSFISKCYTIKKYSKFQTDEWDQTIQTLAEQLSHFRSDCLQKQANKRKNCRTTNNDIIE